MGATERYIELEKLGITTGVLSSIKIVIVVLDKNGCFVWVNRECERVTGYRLR